MEPEVATAAAPSSPPNVFSRISSAVSRRRHYADFIVQSVTLVIVITFCLYNLTVGADGRDYWLALLGPCLGFLLPAPKPRRRS